MQVTWMGSDLLLVSLFPLKFSESWVIFFFFLNCEVFLMFLCRHYITLALIH